MGLKWPERGTGRFLSSANEVENMTDVTSISTLRFPCVAEEITDTMAQVRLCGELENGTEEEFHNRQVMS
jgi:hypothetical protein